MPGDNDPLLGGDDDVKLYFSLLIRLCLLAIDTLNRGSLADVWICCDSRTSDFAQFRIFIIMIKLKLY